MHTKPSNGSNGDLTHIYIRFKGHADPKTKKILIEEVGGTEFSWTPSGDALLMGIPPDKATETVHFFQNALAVESASVVEH